MTVGVNDAGKMRQEGILDAAVVAVYEGDALYWDDDDELRICDETDHYRFAGLAMLCGSDEPAVGGDRVAVDTEGIRTAWGDGASTYLRGKMVTTGALGTLVPYHGEKLLEHTVTAAEEAADSFDLPDYVGAVLAVRNVDQDINFTRVEAQETIGASQVKEILPTGTALGSLEFNTGDIVDTNVVNIVYVPKAGIIGKIVGEPDGDDKMFVQLGGR